MKITKTSRNFEILYHDKLVYPKREPFTLVNKNISLGFLTFIWLGQYVWQNDKLDAQKQALISDFN